MERRTRRSILKCRILLATAVLSTIDVGLVMAMIVPSPQGHSTSVSPSGVRILCWIPTTEPNHKSRAIHVKETWCRRCDKCVFMSNITDPSLPSVNMHIVESWVRLWEKTQKALKYVYDTEINNYDWFLKADDDTYVIVENLRYFLAQHRADEAVYFGAKFHIGVEQGFMSGGAGYVLSRQALRIFVTEALKDEELCALHRRGYEDEELGRCMEKINVTAGDSRDLEGRHRFLPEPPEFFFTNGEQNWFQRYSFYPLQRGRNCCSPLVVSFHHIEPALMQALDYLIYDVKVYNVSRSW